MENGKTMSDRLSLLLNKAMIIYMKNNITYKGIYRGMGKKKKLVFDLTEKTTKVRVENGHPVYEKKVMHSTEYINPEDVVNFEVDKKTSTESTAEVCSASQDEIKQVPVAYAQPPPGNPAPPTSCVSASWVYHAANLNGQIVFFPQLYQNIPYMYYPLVPPVQPPFPVNIQPMQGGIPNMVHPQSEPPMCVNNQALHNYKLPEMQSQNRYEQQPNCSYRNPNNLMNQASNSNYGLKLKLSPKILHTYSITQLMAGAVPGAENLFQNDGPDLQERSAEEFELEPTVGVLPLKRPKQKPSVYEDKNSYKNGINPGTINNNTIHLGKIDNAQNETKSEETYHGSATNQPKASEVEYQSVPSELINLDLVKSLEKSNRTDICNTNPESSQPKYTILKRENSNPILPSLPLPKAPSKSPMADFEMMSPEDFETYMCNSLGKELMSLINGSCEDSEKNSTN